MKLMTKTSRTSPLTEFELLVLGLQAQVDQVCAGLRDARVSDERREAMLEWARALRAELIALQEHA